MSARRRLGILGCKRRSLDDTPLALLSLLVLCSSLLFRLPFLILLLSVIISRFGWRLLGALNDSYFTSFTMLILGVYLPLPVLFIMTFVIAHSRRFTTYTDSFHRFIYLPSVICTNIVLYPQRIFILLIIHAAFAMSASPKVVSPLAVPSE